MLGSWSQAPTDWHSQADVAPGSPNLASVLLTTLLSMLSPAAHQSRFWTPCTVLPGELMQICVCWELWRHLTMRF